MTGSDPATGRWTSKDPSRFEGGWNLYAYSYNDPVTYIDINGRNPLIIVGICLGGGCEAAASAAAAAAGTAIAIIGGNVVGKSIRDWWQSRADPAPDANPTADCPVKLKENQDALTELAKKAKKLRDLNVENAETLIKWAKEYKMPARNDIGKDHWIGGDHIHVGSQNHIPVKQ